MDFSNSRLLADGVVTGLTSRDGQYFPGYLNAIFGIRGEGAGGNANRDNSDKFKFVAALDQETAMMLWLPATPDIKMVTPVTALLYAPGSDATKLKTQLGLVGSLFGMATNPDLATYDGIAEAASGDANKAADAARMSAAIIRVLAINAGLSAIGYRSSPDLAARDVSIVFNEGGEGKLSSCLRDAPGEFIFTNDRMAGIAQCFTKNPPGISAPALTLKPSTWQAIAHLINAYSAALPVRVETPADRARWMLGLKGYLVPAIAQLASADSDPAAAAALAVNTQTILDQTARYVDHYSYNPTGLFMPGPDFVTIASGTSQTVTAETLRRTDVQFGELNGGLAMGGTVQSVSVPAANAGQLSATLIGTTVTVNAVSGFRGVTWFDYSTRSDAGEERTARVYVRVY